MLTRNCGLGASSERYLGKSSSLDVMDADKLLPTKIAYDLEQGFIMWVYMFLKNVYPRRIVGCRTIFETIFSIVYVSKSVQLSGALT